MLKHTGVEVELTGADGNVFALIGDCRKALRRSGMGSEELSLFMDAFVAEATSSDYNHALDTIEKYFDVL
jgi:hypothetical protein